MVHACWLTHFIIAAMWLRCCRSTRAVPYHTLLYTFMTVGLTRKRKTLQYFCHMLPLGKLGPRLLNVCVCITANTVVRKSPYSDSDFEDIPVLIQILETFVLLVMICAPLSRSGPSVWDTDFTPMDWQRLQLGPVHYSFSMSTRKFPQCHS